MIRLAQWFLSIIWDSVFFVSLFWAQDFHSYFFLCCAKCRILVPQLGIEPTPLQWKHSVNVNLGTVGEVPPPGVLLSDHPIYSHSFCHCFQLSHNHIPYSWFISLSSSFFFRPCQVACGTLVPLPGIEPVPPAVEAQSLNHWTTREVPPCLHPCLIHHFKLANLHQQLWGPVNNAYKTIPLIKTLVFFFFNFTSNQI